MLKLDFTITLGDIIAAISLCMTIAAAGWGILRKLDRILGCFKDFPPHRHVDGRIVYPKDYEPPAVEKLDSQVNA